MSIVFSRMNLFNMIQIYPGKTSRVLATMLLNLILKLISLAFKNLLYTNIMGGQLEVKLYKWQKVYVGSSL